MRGRRILAVAFLLSTGACILPARSFGAYEEKAATTAEAVLSAVEEARLVIRLSAERKGFAAYMTTLIDEAEDDASSAQSTFESIQPPDDSSRALADALAPFLDAAVGAIEDMRVAARSGRLHELPRAHSTLHYASSGLKRFLEEHS